MHDLNFLVSFCAEPIGSWIEPFADAWEPAVARLATVATSVSLFVVFSIPKTCWYCTNLVEPKKPVVVYASDYMWVHMFEYVVLMVDICGCDVRWCYTWWICDSQCVMMLYVMEMWLSMCNDVIWMNICWLYVFLNVWSLYKTNIT